MNFREGRRLSLVDMMVTGSTAGSGRTVIQQGAQGIHQQLVLVGKIDSQPQVSLAGASLVTAFANEAAVLLQQGVAQCLS